MPREENINTIQDINIARFAPFNATEITGRVDEIPKGNTDKDRETCKDCGKTFARRQDLNRHIDRPNMKTRFINVQHALSNSALHRI